MLKFNITLVVKRGKSFNEKLISLILGTIIGAHGVLLESPCYDSTMKQDQTLTSDHIISVLT